MLVQTFAGFVAQLWFQDNSNHRTGGTIIQKLVSSFLLVSHITALMRRDLFPAGIWAISHVPMTGHLKTLDTSNQVFRAFGPSIAFLYLFSDFSGAPLTGSWIIDPILQHCSFFISSMRYEIPRNHFIATGIHYPFRIVFSEFSIQNNCIDITPVIFWNCKGYVSW